MREKERIKYERDYIKRGEEGKGKEGKKTGKMREGGEREEGKKRGTEEEREGSKAE